MLNFELIEATLTEYPIIQNMGRFYAYDMSRHCGQKFEGWEFPENGLYECFDFKKHFLNPNAHTFLIKINNELAGFVFVGKIEIMPEVDWNMEEFYIVAKFQQSGVGKAVAKKIFELFSGEWSVGAITENRPALHFWRKAIGEYTHGQFTEVYKSSEELKTPEKPDPFPMMVLRFKSKNSDGK